MTYASFKIIYKYISVIVIIVCVVFETMNKVVVFLVAFLVVSIIEIGFLVVRPVAIVVVKGGPFGVDFATVVVVVK